jgi:5-methylcytosine-specific restriction endonuclease McrA
MHKTLTRAKLLSMGFPATTSNSIKNGGRDYAREWVRIRDKHTCQICMKVWVPGTRRLDVHHTDESQEGKSHIRGASASDKLNMDKMITLCHKCHLNLDSVRQKMGSGLGKTPLDV